MSPVTADKWSAWLADEAVRRDRAGLTRRLRTRSSADQTIDLAGNDYLGLARDPAVRRAAAGAALLWGAGASASRLVTGTLTVHEELERELADYLGQPAALVLSTGYHANLAAVTALADRTVRVISDAHVHASLVDGVRLSKARLTIVEHNDVDAVRTALAAAVSDGERAMVLVESIYSVLGDSAPLVELAELCEHHDALLVVDEAHALGVHGPGMVRGLGLAGLPHVVITATLSKSLGAQGGVVLGPAVLREQLVNRARPFIFDTGLAPAATAGALAALRETRARPDLGTCVRSRVAELARELQVAAPSGAVLSVPMPSPQTAATAQLAALEAGIRIGCFRPPSVPDGISRLRITATAGISDAEWNHAIATLAVMIKDYR